MNKTITELIIHLKQTKAISSQPDLGATLMAINEFSEDEALQAYLLGSFFRYKIDSDSLLPQDKKILINTIKNQNLETYFYLKKKPDEDKLRPLAYILIIGGFLTILGGSIQLINGSFSYGIGTKYMVPIVRGGGIFVILGIGSLFAGIIRLRYNRRKINLIKSLANEVK